MKYLKQLLILLISVASIKSELEENSCSASRKMDDLCGSYCYGIVKPLLRYAETIQSKEMQFNELTDIIRKLEATVEKLKGQIKLGDANEQYKLRNEELLASKKLLVDQIQNLTINNYNNEVQLNTQISNRDLEISQLKSQVLANSSKVLELLASKKLLVDQIQNLTISKNNNEVELKKRIRNQNLIIFELKLQTSANATQVKQLKTMLSDVGRTLTSSCIDKPKGYNAIKVPGAFPFSVFCNGNGWTIVQYRQDGTDDFNRNWHDYRVGFIGDNGDYFIGLDKLYLITKSQKHELHIVMEDFRDNYREAKYSNFRIGGAETNFRLLSLGEFSGDAYDAMSERLNRPFSTKDKSNSEHCADIKSGWWFSNNCYSSNLNGIYKTNSMSEVNWMGWNFVQLKFAAMAIRPVEK